MARCISLKPFPYVLEAELNLPKSEQTTWWLRRLTAQELAEVGNAISSRMDGGDGNPERLRFDLNPETVNNAFLRAGLVGWDNFLGENDNQVQFAPREPDGKCPWVNLDIVDPRDRAELAGVIERGSKLTETDRKNLQSAHGSQGEE